MCTFACVEREEVLGEMEKLSNFIGKARRPVCSSISTKCTNAFEIQRYQERHQNVVPFLLECRDSYR
jgi:hypothetical protein